MQCALFVRQYARSIISSLFLLAIGSTAFADVYDGSTLSIPFMTVGNMNFASVVVVPGTIVSGPTGASGSGTDSYDPVKGELTIPNVTVGTSTFHNVVITIKSVQQIGSVSNADSYSAPDLSITSVEYAGQIFNNVVVKVTAANILGASGGMPNAVQDVYSGGVLSIPAVSFGGSVFTNVRVTVAGIVSVGGIDTPSVVGLTQAAATPILAAADLVLGTVSTATSATVAAGDIISQSPAAGADSRLGGAVNITVSTGNTGGGGTGTGLGWFPFIATPVGAGGQNGLFVLPNNPLEATAANVHWIIPDTAVMTIGTTFVLESGNEGVGFWPYAGFYAAVDSNSTVQIYQVSLTNASASVPTATPVGAFGSTEKLSSLASICDTHGTQTNILQPTSGFIVVHIAGTTGCNTSGDTWVEVSETTTVPVNITTTDYQEFYNPSGALTGIVLHDPATNNVYWYADGTFTHPTTLFSNSTADDSVFTWSAESNAGFHPIGTVHFREIGGASGTALYRVDYTGPSSFKAIPGLALTADDTVSANGPYTGTSTDGTNFYFTDSNFSTVSTALYQEPIGAAGSTPTAPVKLYSAASYDAFDVLGSNGSVVVLESQKSGSPTTSMLGTVPVGVANTANPTQIGPTFNGTITTSQMLSGSATNFANSAVFVNDYCPTCTPPTQPYSTGILAPNGTVLETLTTDSVFLPVEGLLGGYVLEVRGITDTSGRTEGGGMLYDVPDYDNASGYLGISYSTCLTFTGGSCATQPVPFVVPANTGLVITGISSNFGVGVSVAGGGVYGGVVANINQQEIGLINMTNTSILPAY